MANITKISDLNLEFVQVSTPTNGDLKLAKSITSSDTSLLVTFEPKDETGASITKDMLIQITSTSSGKRFTETMLVTAISGTTLTVTRGIALGGLDFAGSASNAIAHQAGAVITANLPAALFQAHDSALKGEIGSTTKFESVPTWDTTQTDVAQTAPVYADATARDAGITTPANGMIIYNTAAGLFQQYIGGAWSDMATGSVANASTTVAGKIEIATNAEMGTATSTGGSGALLVPANDQLVKTSSGSGDENKIPVLGADGKLGDFAGITGEIRMWSTGVAPTGWLICDGSAKDSVTDTTLAGLFAVIGTTYGGTGAADFNLPDFRGRTPIGSGTGDATDATAHTLASKTGTETHTLTIDEMPAHTHNYNDRTGTGAGSGAFAAAETSTSTATSSTGGGTAHNIMQPSLTINFIIKK